MPSDPAALVVVVSWNTAALLDTCLEALRADHDAGLVRVVVVDNGSTDGSPARVRERHPWASLVEAGANLGYGPAVNLGCAHDAAAHPGPPPRWLVAANADVAVHPGALRDLVAAGDGDPRTAVLAPRLVLPDGAVQHHVHPFPSLAALAAIHLPSAADLLPVGRVMEGRWDPYRPAIVDWAHGALLLVRRGAFDAIGGFRADQWLYAEDVDLAWRLRRAGWRTRYVPHAAVTHAVSAATRQAWTDDRARDDRKQAATYAWMQVSLGRRRTALLAGVAWAAARFQARREPAGWRRDRALAYAARHRRGFLAAVRRRR